MRKPPFFILIIIIAAVILLIFLNSIGWLAQPKNVFYKVTNPIQKVFKKGGDQIYNFFQVFVSIKDLREENIRFQEENQRLWAENIRLIETEKENQTLRQQLELASKRQLQLVLASVISRNPASLGQYIKIDKGSRDGLLENMPVVISEGFLVGKIIEISARQSFILLITDPSSLIPALVQDSRADGLVKGEHGLGVKMDMIPQNEIIKKGDIVLTSGLGGEFPKGLIIGEIEEVKEADNQVFQQALLKPSVDFHHLENVFVIIEY